MFHSLEYLKKKTGPDGVGRYDFLKQLIVEFNTTRSLESKYQVLANLANFAYDPINFEYLKQLHCIDLFLAQLSENNEKLIEFALAGLCNIVVDPEAKAYIVGLNGVHLISQLINHTSKHEILLNSLSLLFYIFKDTTLPSELKKDIEKLENDPNLRVKNLAKILLNANK